MQKSDAQHYVHPRASQSFAAAAAKVIQIIFAGGVYVGKNYARSAV